MKQLFVILAIFEMALSANAQVREDVTPKKDSIEVATTQKANRLRATENLYERWTNAKKETEFAQITGWRLGIGASGQYATQKFGGWEKGAITPMGTIGVEYDGHSWWAQVDTLKSPVRTLTGEVLPAGTLIPNPVRLFSYELSVSMGPRWYNQTSSERTAGKVYFAFDVNAYLKVKLWEDKEVRHRLNLMLGPGFTYREHETVDDFGNWKSLVDGSTKHLTDPILYEASGLRAAAGLAYSFRGQHKRDKLEVRLLATYNPYDNYEGKTMKPGVELGILYYISFWKN